MAFLWGAVISGEYKGTDLLDAVYNFRKDGTLIVTGVYHGRRGGRAFTWKEQKDYNKFRQEILPPLIKGDGSLSASAERAKKSKRVINVFDGNKLRWTFYQIEGGDWIDLWTGLRIMKKGS